MDMKADVTKAAITRTMWRKKLDPTKVDEYIDRHENIWPELYAAIKEQGVKNYSIFIDGNECIGYFEHENIAEHKSANEVPTQLSIDWENLSLIASFIKFKFFGFIVKIIFSGSEKEF